MSMPQNPPPGGTTPKVHHSGAAVTSLPADGNPLADTFIPSDYNNPAINDFMTGHLPLHIIYDGDQPRAAPLEPPPQPTPPITAEQAAKRAGDQVAAGLTTQPETFWSGINGAVRLRFLMDGVETKAVKIDLPFNSTQICDGGLAMIKTIQSAGKKAEFLQVDPLAVGKDIALILRIRGALEQVDWIKEVLLANESVVLGRVADAVDQGLRVGASVIAADGDMSVMLRQATAIRKVPSAIAQATRTANARQREDVRKQEAARLVASTTPATPTLPAPAEGDKTKQ